MPRFSIVVPVYNVIDTLSECVLSALAVSDSEILLVDDGSTDGSGELCDSLASQYSDRDIRVFHKENEGLLLTRRFGFRHAQGDFIVNLDSDDRLEPCFEEKISEVIDSVNPDVIFFKANTFELGVPTGSISREDVLYNFAKSTAEPFVSMWSKVYKRSVLDMDRDYFALSGLKFGEDTIQSLEIYANANSFYCIDEALYFYRIGTGVTAKYYENYYSDFATVTHELLKHKGLFKVSDFESLIALKYFNFLGRSITQTRLKSPRMSATEHRKLFEMIKSDDNYRKFEGYTFRHLRQVKPVYAITLILIKTNNFRLLHLLLSL